MLSFRLERVPKFIRDERNGEIPPYCHFDRSAAKWRNLLNFNLRDPRLARYARSLGMTQGDKKYIKEVIVGKKFNYQM